MAVVVLIACLTAVACKGGPWRWMTSLTGSLGLAGAVYAQITLARQSRWPEVALVALHRVRKHLWSEALGLWARNPVTGGGAGSFRETNALSRDSDLAMAHSSTLQAGSEFGFVGLAIFGRSHSDIPNVCDRKADRAFRDQRKEHPNTFSICDNKTT